jgi:flagellar basal body-associated protein FliL
MNVDKIGIKLNKKKGDSETKSNPKKVNLMSIILGMPIRAASLGILGTIPFMVNESGWTIFYFYIGYILTMIITILSQYIMTSYKTTHSHKSALKKVVLLQGLLLAEIRKKLNIVKPVEPIKEEEVIEQITLNTN